MGKEPSGATWLSQEETARAHRRQVAARALLAALSFSGLVLIAKAVAQPDLEARTFPLIALAFTLGPITAELTRNPKGRNVRLPLAHCVLFGSALALGPLTASLPAAASGISKLLTGRSPERPLFQVLYAVLKPATVCSTTAMAYSAAGGNAYFPQALDSAFAIACAAITYVATGMVAAWAIDKYGDSGNDRPLSGVSIDAGPSLFFVSASWLACLTGGYLLAIAYSVVPPYVLCVPALVASALWLALREPAARVEEPVAEDDVTPATGEEQFVDPATGIASRRYLEMFIAGEASRAQRSRKPLSVAIFDLDNLRSLVESGGRDAVDGVLRSMADVIRSGLRDYDLVARYSVGRLVVVLPEAATETACEIAERLHESVSKLEVSGRALDVTVGLATLPDHADSAEQLINAAHHALNRGRFVTPNRVHSYQDLAKAG